LTRGLPARHKAKKEIGVTILTYKQWDELLESFEVMKYDANEDEQRKKLEKDIQGSSNQYGKRQIESVPLPGQQTARTSSLL